MSDYKKPFKSLESFIPSNLKNIMNTSLSKNVFDKFLTYEESSHFYGTIGERPGSVLLDKPTIYETTTERKYTSLAPVLVTQYGTDEYVTTFKDILNKASTIGIDTNDFKNWGKTQTFNFCPPINIDKFINYKQYFWIQKALPNTSNFWNVNQLPEYYVIEKPKNDNINKIQVDVATSNPIFLNSTTQPNNIWTILFTSATTFKVIPSIQGDTIEGTISSQYTPIITDQFSCTLKNNDIAFQENDSIIIQFHHLTSISPTITYNCTGNGYLQDVKSLLTYGVIDGLTLKNGLRVLVKAQQDSSENGIYFVSNGIWNKTLDSTNTILVYVKSGSNSGLWLNGTNNNFSKINTQSNLSEWTQYNFWVHKDDLYLYGLTLNDSSIFQAVRPIIEYDLDLELNLSIKKNKFNQIPLFNLFYHDGTPVTEFNEILNTDQQISSGLFYYLENILAPIDVELQRRIVTNNSNYLFSQGVVYNDRLVFFKKNNELKTSWVKNNNYEIPRYVTSGANDEPVDWLHNPSKDLNSEGTWLIPMQLSKNYLQENRLVLSFGDMFNHFSNIISHQNGLIGSTFGNNNSRTLDFNNGLGGLIKIIPTRFNLFAGLLNQRDLTPIGIIDFLEQQYSISINSIVDYIKTNCASILSNSNFTISNKIDLSDDTNKLIFENYKTYYNNRSELTNVYKDTSNPIPNWPITLPLSGLTSATNPTIIFDDVINSNMLVFHDGHQAPVYARDLTLEQQLSALEVLRFDGQTTPGLYGMLPSSVRPYKGQFWFDSTEVALKIFNVNYEGDINPTNPKAGDYWYNRTTNNLFVFTTSWEISYDDRWTIIDISNIINSVILIAEKTIYDYWKLNNEGFNLNYDITNNSVNNLSFELSKFAIQNNLDPFGSVYNSADAFSWNYGYSTILESYGLTSYARWHKIYQQLFNTSRPDLYPWKLFGHDQKPSNWNYDSDYKTVNSNLINLDGVCTLNLSDYLIENPNFSNGDKLLSLTHNKIYTLIGTSFIDDITYQIGQQFKITKGKWANSIWQYNTNFVQVRRWKSSLWSDLKNLYPNLKLCVNVNTDELLPPYVNSSNWFSSEALITNLANVIMPQMPYSFGDEGPVEYIWKNTLEFKYSQVRCSFKQDPINFLTKSWGFQTFDISELPIDRFTGNFLSHKNFNLHGESRNVYKINSNPIVYFGDVSEDKVYTLIATNFIDDKIIFTDSINKLSIPVNTLVNDILLIENGIPFVIGDKVILTIANNTYSYNLIPANKVNYVGLNQAYINLLRYNSYDLNSINEALLRKSNIQLGYEASSLLDTELFKAKTVKYEIPPTSYKIALKTNEFAKHSWIHALRIQVIGISQNSTLLSNGFYAPTNKGADWVFRIENYVKRYPKIEHYQLKPNSEYTTFNALNSIHADEEWHLPYETNGKKITNLPLVITGLQNVIDFINSYTMLLIDEGWVSGTIDNPETDPISGRIIDWQLELEKFIDSLYLGVKPGTGLVLNPFIKNCWIETKTGLVSNFNHRKFDDVTTSQSAYDLVGDIIDPGALLIIRNDQNTMISSDVPLFAIHCNITEYTHIVLFNNYIDNTHLIFDPFFGSQVNKILISGKKQNNNTKRPTFGGYYLNNNKTQKNLVSAISDFGNVYNSDTVYENLHTTNHALSVLGFNQKDYFNNIEIDEKSQFNFWRGLINAKGTTYSIDAFLNNLNYETAKVDEFWAYKIAEYGDARVKDYPELKIQPSDCILKHTRLFFQSNENDIINDAVTYINPLDENRWFTISDINSDLSFEAELVGGNKNYSKLRKGYDLTSYNDQIIYDEEDFNITNNEFTILTSTINQLVELPFVCDKIIGYPETFEQITNNVVKCFEVGYYSFNGYIPLKPKFNPIKLFDYKNNQHIEDISVWHPAFNMHTPESFDVINIVSDSNPALFNYSLIKSNNANYNPVKSWGDREIGKIWWDTNNLNYIPYYDKFIFPEYEERLSRWGMLAEYSSINVYEWIKSDIAPNLYDEQVLVEQGNSNISNDIKKTGTAAKRDLYKRTRTWQSRAIAWSYIPNPSTDHLLQMFTFASDRLYLSSKDIGAVTVTLENGTFDQYQLNSGMYIGGWIVNKPYGELVLSNSTGYFYGASNLIGDSTSITYPANTIFSHFIISQNSNYVGTMPIGKIEFTLETTNSISYLIATEIVTNKSQKILLVGLTNGLTTITYDFFNFGFTLTGYIFGSSSNTLEIGNEIISSVDFHIRQYRNGSISIPFNSLVLDNELPVVPNKLYSNELSIKGIINIDSIFVSNIGAPIGNYSFSYIDNYLILNKDGIEIERVLVDNLETINFNLFSLQISLLDNTISINNLLEEISLLTSLIVVGYNNNEISFITYDNVILTDYNWRGWTVPSQADLLADRSLPYSSWTPYYGDWVDMPILKSILDDVDSYNSSKLSLNSGAIVEKYNSLWTDWNILKDEYITKISSGSIVNFSFSQPIISNHFSLYINGINQMPSTYLIDSNYPNDVITRVEVPIGHKVTALLRHYDPSTKELGFDPLVEDDVYTLVQYKYDYQYVVNNIRDNNGNVIGQKYYFWVKGKTIPKAKKTLSCQQAELLLKNGPSTYLTFQHLINDRYKSITIANLNQFVGMENTFKLRFTRDFTLRDDPNEIDLKNTHVEWTLIRPNSKVKIPRQLWDKIIDSACGQTLNGKLIPSKVRVDYDLRHGTRTKYGFENDQIMIDTDLIRSSLLQAILNPQTTKFINGYDIPDVINNLDFSKSEEWFLTPSSIRQLLEFIWIYATPEQLNGIFFEVLNDALANNYDFTDLFKTSRLSAHSITSIT
jgi:hypothetical protein